MIKETFPSRRSFLAIEVKTSPLLYSNAIFKACLHVCSPEAFFETKMSHLSCAGFLNVSTIFPEPFYCSLIGIILILFLHLQ